MSDTRNIFLTLRKSVKLTKWKVEEGTIIYDGRVLLLYEETDSGKSAKLKSKNVGSVSKLLVKEGDVVNPGYVKPFTIFVYINIKFTLPYLFS